MKATHEQINVVVDFLRDVVRNQPLIPFHVADVYEPFSSRFHEWLGLEGATAEKLRPILLDGAAVAEEECPALRVLVGSRLNESMWGMTVAVKPEGEWYEIQQWAFRSADASRCLSPSASELLTRVEEGDIGDDFISELSVRRRIRLFGYCSSLDRIVEEIRIKRGISLKVEERGERWHQRKHLLKITIESREDPMAPIEAPNPVVPVEIVDAPDGKRQFRRWFGRTILETPLDGSDLKHVWRIETRKEFFRCFPWCKGKDISADAIAGWIQVLRNNAAFNVGWNLGSRAGTWTVVARPPKSWPESKTILRQELERPTVEEEFGLSSAAGALFEWLQSLPDERFELGLTPIVEEAIQRKDLLLESPWERENFALYLRLLCEEISKRTKVCIEPVRWAKQGASVNRILKHQ